MNKAVVSPKNEMRAAALYGAKDIRIISVKSPEISDDEILIEVKACGVCATDVKKYAGASKIPKIPFITGHEFSGTVVKVGKSASKFFEEGDRVVGMPVVTCQKCHSCITGLSSSIGVALCQNYKVIGHSVDGAFAEYVKLPWWAAVKLPENLDFVEATLTEPLADCLNGADKGSVSLGDDVLIIGAGVMGLLTAIACKLRGADVMISDLLDERLQVAKEIGVDEIVNPTRESIEEKVKTFTGGRGVNSVIISIGGKSIIENVTSHVRSGGKVVILASIFPPTKVEVDPNDLHYRLISMIGCVSYTFKTFNDALHLIADKKVPLEKIITDRVNLENIKNAFEEVMQKKGLRHVVVF